MLLIICYTNLPELNLPKTKPNLSIAKVSRQDSMSSNKGCCGLLSSEISLSRMVDSKSAKKVIPSLYRHIMFLLILLSAKL